MHPGTAAGLRRRLTPTGSVLAVLALLAALLGTGAVTQAAQATTTAPTVVSPTTVIPTDVGRPAWWDGDCDANRWGRIAASYGWTGQGSHRMGAVYLGVPVCGPRPWVDGSPNVLWGRSGWGEAEWQCVELAQRFMAQVYGTKAYQANGSQVVQNYSTTYGGGLVKITNGTVGKAPVPGDVVSFTTTRNPWGHVVVVTKAVVDGNGNGTVTMMSQNDTSDGWRTLSMSGWRLANLGTLTPYGWLHDPLGRGNPLGDGSFVRPSDQSTIYRIAGGAPIPVTSWDAYGGPRPYAVIDPPQFARLTTYPADGTFLRDAASKAVYRVAGGAPLLVSSTDAPKLPGWGVAPVIDVDPAALTLFSHLRPYPVDHTQLCRVDDGSCYVVAGGAPLLVPAAQLATTPGWVSRRTVKVSGAEFTAWKNLRANPVDGTFVCDSDSGACYRTAGGAPLLIGAADPAVPGFSAVRVVRAPHWEFARAVHLAAHPADGTVLCPVGDAQCYVVAGHAPIAIARAAVPAVPTKGAVAVSRTELRAPRRLAARPVDGTVLRSAQTGATYIVKAGSAILQTDTTTTATTTRPAVTIDQTAVNFAGVAGAWSHLASTPASVQIGVPPAVITQATAARIAWTTPVASSAVVKYDVRYRRAAWNGTFGAWMSPARLQGLTTTQSTTGLARGYDYCFQVRAVNRAGQVGPWSTLRCSAAALDQTAATLTSTGWKQVASATLYGGTALRTTLKGSWWRVDGAQVARVGLVATTCVSCGRVAVVVNGVRVGIIDLASPTTVDRALLALPRFTLTTGRVTLIAMDAGKLVQIDGVALSRT